MALFKLRSQRISVEIPVKIFLKDKSSGEVTDEYRLGRLVKISKSGACFIVDSMILKGNHLFFSSQEMQKNHILVREAESEKDLAKYDLTAFSVWMDGVTLDKKQFFKVGVKFTESQDELFVELKKKAGSKQSDS